MRRAFGLTLHPNDNRKLLALFGLLSNAILKRNFKTPRVIASYSDLVPGKRLTGLIESEAWCETIAIKERTRIGKRGTHAGGLWLGTRVRGPPGKAAAARQS